MSDDLDGALGRIIASRAEEIERRWVERISADIAGRNDVELTQLRDGIPDYLRELARLIAEPTATPDGEATWLRVARDHGITRVQVGFDIEQLVHEFVALRKIIEQVGAEAGALTRVATTRLSDVIEAAIAKSVQSYVETRDFEARRRQAENIGFLIHELRNPLSAAVTAAGLLRDTASPAQRTTVDILDRGLQRLTQLIDSVLLTEKLEAGRAEPHAADVRIGELVERSTASARELARTKGIALEVRCDPDRTIRADVELTRSALQNLVDNAVKYTDSGSVEVAVREDARAWQLHVRDTCAGLSSEELRTIFEPFRRGSTAMAKKGTGLGLAIARRAIEAQGGSIHAESTGSCGCHFWFTLPKP